MTRRRLIIVTALVGLSVSAATASSAHADVYSCAFTGAAGPVTAYSGGLTPPDSETGVESIVYDATVEGPLDDDDNQNGGLPDGSYQFTTDQPGGGAAVCLYVSQGGGAGVFPAAINSQGEYNNIVCSTGTAVDSGSAQMTRVTLNPGPDITEADYRINFTAGQGVLDITHAITANGQTGTGLAVDGFVSIEPTQGNCITTHVTAFQAAGGFAITTS